MADMSGLDPQFRTRFGLAVQAIERELGIAVSVVSAYRSRAEQARLYDAWLRKQRGEPGYGWANLAAPPGKSNHEHGLAIDITPNSTPAMREVFWRYGLTFPVKGEPWHVEPITARGGTYPPLPGEQKPAPPQEDDMPLNDADKQWLDATVERHVKFWGEQNMKHANGVGDSVVKRVSEGFLAALVNAVRQIKG